MKKFIAIANVFLFCIIAAPAILIGILIAFVRHGFTLGYNLYTDEATKFVDNTRIALKDSK